MSRPVSCPFGPLTEMHAPAPMPPVARPPSSRWPAPLSRLLRRRWRRMRRWLRRLLLTSAWALTLSGCGTTPPPQSLSQPAPPQLTQPCAAPPPLADGSAPALLQNHVEAMRRFAQCAARHQQLVRWIESQRSPR